MASRRPLVRDGGRTRQLPPGDTLYGIPVYLAVYQRAGAMLRVAISAANYTVPITKQGGGTLSVGVAING